MKHLDVFAAIADPRRRQLLDALLEGSLSAGQLVASLPELTQPAVSRHLRILRDVGLVDVTPSGQHRIYILRAARLTDVDHWIVRYRQHIMRELSS